MEQRKSRALAVAMAAMMFAVGFAGCDDILGVDRLEFGCVEGLKRCTSGIPEICDAKGLWRTQSECAIGTICNASNGECIIACELSHSCECTLGEKGCNEVTGTPRVCGPDRLWKNDANGPCMHQSCNPSTGTCEGECAPDEAYCIGNTPQTCKDAHWTAMGPCPQGFSCQGGLCLLNCLDGDWRCFENYRQKCIDGEWINQEQCIQQTCDWTTAECIGICAPGDGMCNGNVPQTCDENGQWKTGGSCMNQTCVAGACLGVCAPGDKICYGNVPQSCDGYGQWQAGSVCVGQTCVHGDCIGVCEPGEGKCNGNVPQNCDENGQWENRPACPNNCVNGTCPGPSCTGLAENCGPNDNENCCLSPVVLGGTYNRSNDATAPATVSDFRLDRFEITVGRFRAFVNGYPANKPIAGAGAHPLIPNSGWQSAWDANLPSTKAELTATPKCDLNTPGFPMWTDTPGPNENKPMNCLDWYVTFAFCAWDRGRLPTEAEWNYAAAAGSEQREYPWSNPPSSLAIDSSYTVYYCEGDGIADCGFADILNVGSKSPRGDGRWKHADLAGSMDEWNLDDYHIPYAVPCFDCATLNTNALKVVRSGVFAAGAATSLTSLRNFFAPGFPFSFLGGRCAKTP